MEKINLIATSTFGLEAVVKREAMEMGFTDIKVEDGRVNFTGDISAIPKANIGFRCADRIRLKIGEFTAVTFDELFEKTKALPFEDWITVDAEFTVTGKSIKSTLFSVPDCQSIVKKAIVERLKTKYDVEWFSETGPKYKLQVAILKDVVTISIDTTGPGLHKRGYRENALQAPLKETLAAALIKLSYYRFDKVLIDPTCGSGTILIEAALIARNIAPGINRNFVSESWTQIPKEVWDNARLEAKKAIIKDGDLKIYGSDIDPKSISLAKENARLAGVEKDIKFEIKDISDIKMEEDFGVIISNPPYGERLGTDNEIEFLYEKMGKTFLSNKTWSSYILTAYAYFENAFGKRADVKRKLFNGTIETQYYQYRGEKPAKNK